MYLVIELMNGLANFANAEDCVGYDIIKIFVSEFLFKDASVIWWLELQPFSVLHAARTCLGTLFLIKRLDTSFI